MAPSAPEIDAYLSEAASACEGRGEKFTLLRRSVLRILLEAERPLRAYDLVPRLEAELDRKISAMTVYRCLEFLLARDLVAQLKSHSAFVARARPNSPHICVLYVCEKCGISVEVEKPELDGTVAPDVAAMGFAVNSHVLEMRGLCFRCGLASPKRGEPG